MILNRQLFAETDFNFHTIFNKAIVSLREKPNLRSLLALEVKSTGRGEHYAWVNVFPKLKEWLSDAQFQRLQAYKFTLENKFWQDGIEVLREDIEDDNLGMVRGAIGALGEAAEMQPDDLIYDLLVSGFGGTKGLAYDGQFFFDTDHKDGNGPSQSNKGTAVLAADGVALAAAIAQMRSLKDESGRVLTFNPTDLIVGPALEDVALKLIEADFLASGASNVYKGRLKVHVVNRLGEYPTYWFLLDASKAIKPFVFQNREAPQFAAQDQPSDEQNFMRRTLRWSAYTRNNAGYALWQMAYGSTGGA